MSSEYASKVLGAALLQGWTMSAEECKREYCPGCPLMVSRDGKDSFCARCDGGEKVGLPRQGLVEPLATSLSSTLQDQTRVSSPTSSREGDDAATELDIHELPTGRDTLPNTPPTPHSRLASPPPVPEALPMLDPQLHSARRAQADRASGLLAQKMLQGWTLLGDECSNESCHSIPLARRPPAVIAKTNDNEGGKSTKVIDPRKHCVICQRDYVSERDLAAYDTFMQATTGVAASTSSATSTVAPNVATAKRSDNNDEEKIQHSAAAKKRRFSTQPLFVPKGSSTVMGFNSAAPADSKGKSRVVSAAPRSSLRLPPSAITPAALPSASASAASAETARLFTNDEHVPAQARRASDSQSNTAVEALEQAVARLSQHLQSTCEQSEVVDPALIAEAAEALARTCRSLEDVKAMYR